MTTLPLMDEWKAYNAVRPRWEALRQQADQMRATERNWRFSVRRAQIEAEGEQIFEAAKLRWYTAVYETYGDVAYNWGPDGEFIILDSSVRYPSLAEMGGSCGL